LHVHCILYLSNMKYLTGLFIILILAGCTNDEITKVELARSGAWADPGAAISIDNTLNYSYYGVIDGEHRDYYVGKATPQFWDSLSRKLEDINFKTIDSTDDMTASDVHYFELIIHWNNTKRRIVRMRLFHRLDSVCNMIEWLNDSYKNIKLKQVNQPITFETTFQNPPPIDSVLLKSTPFKPPPTKKRK